MLLAISLVLVFIALYLVAFYNRLSTAKVRIGASIQEIGNQLKRQSDLIPNLVDSVKGYMTHEKGIFDQLTEARKTVTQAALTQDGQKIDASQDLINKALNALRVVVESNPQIQASNLVNDLLNELRDTADKVMYARRTLIDLTADYNTSIATVPGIWLAPIFRFYPEKGFSTPTHGDFLQVNEKETQAPKVNF